MFTKLDLILMDNSNLYLKYDSRFSQRDIALLRKCIGFSITSIDIESPSITLPPQFHVENNGVCLLNLFQASTNRRCVLTMKSTYVEIPPIGDGGGFTLSIKESKILSFKEQLNRKKEPSKLYVPFDYPDQSPIISFQVFGSSENRNIEQIDPNIELEDIKRFGYTNWNKVDINTVEFIIISHRSGMKSVFSSMSSGLYYNFLIDDSFLEMNKDNFYMKSNGSTKNIIIHHDIV